MLRVNKKTEYGILALLHLAARPDQVASVREIARSCRIPETLLSKIMQSMKTHGLVSAVYGNHGGYRLAKELSRISLLDINEVLVGPVRVAECLEADNHECPAQATCAIMSPMNALNDKLVQLFQSTSLESLATRKIAS